MAVESREIRKARTLPMKDLGLVPFVRFFPQQAARETRTLTTRRFPGLPDDEDGLLESYCADPRCNCRRVMERVCLPASLGQRNLPFSRRR